jgi:hypothetical protein
VTNINEADKSAPGHIETRYVSANGNWHTVKALPEGSTLESFAEAGRGVFNYAPGRQKIVFMSDYILPKYMSHDEWREGLLKSSQFDRVETVAGQEVCVMKVSDTFEVYRALALNGGAIKWVVKSGGANRMVDPISITPGEPDAANLQTPQLPVDYEPYRNKQEAIKNRSR